MATEFKVYRSYRGDYFDGYFVPVKNAIGEIHSKNPGNLELAPVAIPFTYDRVSEVASVAKKSFQTWKRHPIPERKKILKKYRDILSERAEDLARLLSFEVGKPLWEARNEVGQCLNVLDIFFGAQTQLESTLGEEKATPLASGNARFFPRGVALIISPANEPAYKPHSQLVPALLNGNSVILKTSRQAPLVGQMIAEFFNECGIPRGVFNTMHGDAELARRLSMHSAIDLIFFTGAPETGQKILKQVVTDHSKTVILESGGINPVVIWEDSHYTQALHETLFAAFSASGQLGTSTRRILIHERILDRFLKDFHGLAKKCRVGYGLTDGGDAPFMGPLMNDEALESYLRFQGIAVREGCEEIMRGKTLDRNMKGFYASPSIHLVPACDPKSVYQKSEIQGPNVALYQVKEIEEVSEIINQPQHTLVSSIYTAKRENFEKLAEELDCGMLNWNLPTTHFSLKLPYGGIRRSGNARWMGSLAGFQCTQILSCLERTSPFELTSLPPSMPRAET